MATSDTLGTNQYLNAGQSLTSQNGTTVLTMQSDGNLVLKGNGNILWSSGTTGKGNNLSASMKWDGNLHITDASGKEYWSNGKSEHKDAFLRLNNDGAMFVWDGSNHEIWDTGTTGYKVNNTAGGGGSDHTDFGGIDQFLKEAANTCGQAWDTIKGVIKIVGPIAAIVVNIIPGIGQVASVAIAGLVAAANAKGGVTSAIVAGISNEIPGGDDPSVQIALQGASSAVDAAASGKPLSTVINDGISALPIDPNIKQTMQNVVNGIAQGASVNSAQIQASLATLPANIQNAIKIGALAGNSAVAGSAANPAQALVSLAHLGLQRESTDPVAAHGKALAGQGSNGYDIGIGASLNIISPGNLAAIRNQLNPVDQKGFDMALSLHMGAMIAPPPPPGTSAVASAAYAMTAGMRSAPSNNKASMMQNISSNPNARPGAVIAIKAIAKAKQDNENWLYRILKFFHLVS